MKKKAIGFVILLALVLVLAAVYLIAVMKWGAPDPDSGLPADTGFTVYACEEDAINGIRIEKDGGVLAFIKTENGWQNAADEHFPVDENAVSTLTSVLSEMKATRRLEGDAIPPLTDIGLDTPALTVRLSLKDGAEREFRFGSYNRHSAAYYLQSAPDSAVYMVTGDYCECFEAGEEEYLLLEDFPSVTAAAVSEISASGPDGQTKMVKTVTAVEGEDGTETEQIGFTHTNTKGEQAELTEEAGMSIISGFVSLHLTDCADYYATDAELETYGLDAAGASVVTMRYTVTLANATDTSSASATEVEKTASFRIGKTVPVVPDASDGADTADVPETPDNTPEKVYIALDGSRMVYRVSLGSAAAFFS